MVDGPRLGEKEQAQPVNLLVPASSYTAYKGIIMNMIESPELQYLATLAGTIGGILSVSAFVPQALRIIRRRSATDVSLTMYLAIMAPSFLWMFYAYVHSSIELFITNLVIGVIAILIAVLRIRYGGR